METGRRRSVETERSQSVETERIRSVGTDGSRSVELDWQEQHYNIQYMARGITCACAFLVYKCKSTFEVIFSLLYSRSCYLLYRCIEHNLEALALGWVYIIHNTK